MKFTILCLLLVCCVCVSGHKILLCFSAPIRSLNILGRAFAKHLMDAGHEVTYITAYPSKDQSKNYKEISLTSLQGFYEGSDLLNISYIMENSQTNDVGLLFELGLELAVRSMEHEKVQALLLDPDQQFDAVIVDYLDTELYAGLAAVYNCPLIWAYSMGPNLAMLQLLNEPANPAYTAHLLSNNVPPLTTIEIIEELWNTVLWNWHKWLKSSKQDEAYNRIFAPAAAKRNIKLPGLQEILNKPSLVLSNFNHATGNIPPLPQSVKLVGGYHVESPTKPLPEDLQKFMDNAKDGIIYFSMGSTWKSKDIPKSITEGLLKIFGGLKQTVIWKYEEELPNLPKNVHVLKWAPQQSVLAHPNVLFFITHGGLLSATETIHFGVPQIGIPIFYDQFTNVNRAVANGFAIRVDLNYDLTKNLKVAIDRMLTDPSYKARAAQVSRLHHARPLLPGAELVYWVDHVARMRGADHLASPARALTFSPHLAAGLMSLLVLIILLGMLAARMCKNGNKKTKRD